MENKYKEQIIKTKQDDGLVSPEPSKPKKNNFFGTIIVSLIVISGIWIYVTGLSADKADNYGAAAYSQQRSPQAADALSEAVAPSGGILLPVRWGSLGQKMTATGVINESQFKALYAQNGGLTVDEQALLDSPNNGNLVINKQNAGIILNLLWAFGLGNKNPILENGPMQDPQYGGAANFASTGGWTIAEGNPMNHYSAHQFVTLTPSEQLLVEAVAKNIYRPCCGNSAYFPDCNHGMAMLGLLELMASQGATENQMYQAALAVNSYWFPDTYLTIARYFANKGVGWDNINPKTVLGAAYSSIQGYQAIQSQVPPLPKNQSSNCGVSLQNQGNQYPLSAGKSSSCGV